MKIGMLARKINQKIFCCTQILPKTMNFDSLGQQSLKYIIKHPSIEIFLNARICRLSCVQLKNFFLKILLF